MTKSENKDSTHKNQEDGDKLVPPSKPNYTAQFPLMISNSKKRNRPELNTFPVSILYDIIDDFKLAIEESIQKRNFDAVIEGLDLIYKKMLTVLKEKEITPFTDEQKPFDPFRHEIIEETKLDPEEQTIIITCLRQGFERNGVVLRRAWVVIGSDNQKDT